ncbi:hypothetical protein DRP53_09395 [candidate division WOR-3 bacterium]|uniref:T9SS type A sorting domain-containing protein n=1 Tax=candidate division WOR-3 bacterium TaxID=2052148 RepID=A0A660SDZ6_UNCW3|nr:MAG: hypothetical protein DRP53_09395 [candidate division WOR-3 bacterium]
MVLLLILSFLMPVRVNFSPSDLRVVPTGSYHRLELPGCYPSWEVGRPEIMVKGVLVEIPEENQVVNYQITELHFTPVEGSYRIRPVPRPQILSLPPRPEPEPDPKIYLSDNPYPEEPIRIQGIHNFMGRQYLELLIYPVRYFPRSGRIELIDRLVISLTLRPKRVNGRVDAVDYLIITNSTMSSEFQRLADWKRSLGFKTWIRDVDWITTNYPGRDRPERIRNYLKTLIDSGIDYLLLGGDTDILPCRFAYAMTCSAFYHPREDSLPCDLYFADLDGTWDRDNDGIFGEVEDSVDLYPDLLVGRAPVNTAAEARAFVDKTITYEKNPSSGYLTSALFAAEYLWPGTDSGLSKDKIGNESFPSYYNLTKLYERLGNESPQAVINGIERGQGLLNHNGHGWIDIMSCATGYLRNYHMDNLNNPNKYGCFYSIGCWTTAFDFDCIAEHFVLNPNGGGIAFVGNSSYGWGSPGNPTFGYSDRFDQRFFHELFCEGHPRLGEALAYDKIHFIPYSREKNVYRWHQYQLNLLGDPSLMIHTKEPVALQVNLPDSLPISSQGIIVTVTKNNLPIPEAWISLRKGGEWFSRFVTDSEGKAILSYQFQTTGSCSLTISAHNYLPSEPVIPVFSSPFPNLIRYFYDDRMGNQDSIPNPNEDIYLTITLKNEGTQPTQDLGLTLRIDDNNFTITDSLESTGPLNPGQERILTDAFQFQIGSVTNGHTGYFELEIRSGSRVYFHKFPIQVGNADFEIVSHRFLNPPPMPGDSDDIRIEIENRGLGFGHQSYAKFSTTDPNLSLYLDSIGLGEVRPEEKVFCNLPVAIKSTAPLGHIGTIVTNFYAQGYQGVDTISFVVGPTGFQDDLESGSGKWHSGGSNNLWHLTEYRAHSPTHSFYCGNESNHKYGNNMDCYIETDPIILDQEYELRFWRWFFVPIYGTDGLYVIIKRSSGSDTLDFIGTGGALKGRGIPGDWFEEVYDLSRYPQGDTIQLRFSFISDDQDVGEGFYLDDVYIGPKLPGVESRLKKEPPPFSIRPSPFTDLLLVSLKEEGGVVSLYNSIGQQVRRIVSKKKLVQIDTQGLPSGVYFLKLETGGETVIEKVVKIR